MERNIVLTLSAGHEGKTMAEFCDEAPSSEWLRSARARISAVAAAPALFRRKSL